MSLSLRTSLGCTEAVLADDGNLNLFYIVARIINDELRLKFVNKEDEFDAINWDFKYKGHPLTLRYDIYNGISVYPTRVNAAQPKDNLAVVELANILDGRLFNGPMKNIA
jgi:hypothetical protein